MRFEELLLKDLDNVEGLTAEQKEQIKTGATAIFQKKTGDLYGGIDNDILSTSGIEKNQGEKTFDYVKRALQESKTDVSEFTTKIETLKAERDELLKNGANSDDFKKQVSKLEKQIADKEEAAENWRTKFEESQTTISEKAEELKKSKIKAALYGETLNFNEAIPEPLRNRTMQSIDNDILNYEIDEDYEVDGKKITVFKKDGSVLRNPENENKPHTAQSLRRSELAAAGLLAEKREQGGAGTNPGGKKNLSSLDLSGVKTKVQATAEIEKFLMSKGLERNSKDFIKEQVEIYKENNVGELPLR